MSAEARKRMVDSPIGLFLLSAMALHDPKTELPTEARRIAAVLVNGVLDTACGGGFAQRDVLETLFARNEVSDRVTEMALEACISAGDLGMWLAYEQAGLLSIFNWDPERTPHG